MKKLFGIIMLVVSLIYMVHLIFLSVKFDQNCEGHLKRAADANSIPLAKKELGVAIKYLEIHDITKGYTSIFWETPDEDVEFWYTNLKSAYSDLDGVVSTTSNLEQTNQLMKLRESLLDHGSSGDSVTYPDGITKYPNNGFYFIMTTLFIIMLMAGVILIMIGLDEY